MQLWNTFHRPEDVKKGLKETLDNLKVGYLDLYLMQCVLPTASHSPPPSLTATYDRSWPVAFSAPPGKDGKPTIDWDLTNDVLPTWRAMEELVESGRVKAIGVSNFTQGRMEKLIGQVRR